MKGRFGRGAQAILAVVLPLCLALSAGHASAGHVGCGDTITADTTLDSDLIDCPNNGVLIGADDITLDLNGHVIDGDGTPAAGCDPDTEFCDAGVVNDGHDGVTVMHGSVREFEDGMLILRTRQNRVLGVSSSTNQFSGILLDHCARCLVRKSSGSGSITPEGGTGIYLFASHDVRILESSFRDNGDRGMGIYDSAHNLIKGSLSRGNFSLGIFFKRSDRNQVRRNRSVRDPFGIVVDNGNRNVIARNRSFKDGRGVGIDKGRGNVVARNVVTRARKEGIYLGVFGGGNNTVRRNRVTGSGGSGFRVNKEDHHSLLKRNRARHSKDDGFLIETRTTKLTDNRAVRNRHLGIDAVAGVIDGGGNVARHNGNPRQCTHVRCHVTRR
jgi:nitrous oxidase accessory protein NosD